MRALFFLSVCLLSAVGAKATSFTVLNSSDHPAVDPATDFELDCLGAVEAEECDSRAAALETELSDHLVALSFETDIETIAVFEDMLPMESPRVQEIATEYFAALPDQPTTIFGQMRVFFFGADAGLGFPASQALARSATADDVALSDRYRRFRTVESHGGGFGTGAGFTDSQALGVANDMQIDDVFGFAPEDQLPGATRLLMDDAVLADVFLADDPTAELTVTAFVSDDSLEEVSAHFTTVFGQEPFPTAATVEAEQQRIGAEMEALQDLVQSGDADAIARFVALGQELAALQGGSSIALRLQLEFLGASDHVYWSALSADAALEEPMQRSVSIGTDPLLGRTVIHYYAGGAGGSEGEGEGEEGEGDGDGASDDDAGGCGCDSSHASGSALTFVCLALLSLRRRSGARLL